MIKESSINAVKNVFERTFLEIPLEMQISHCDHYELLPWFKQWLPDNQPILEAGCGSGRWVIWFIKQGWEAVGLDWSKDLIARANSYLPRARFEVGDMRNMPFHENEFGAIISLGAIEHTIDGPCKSLREYFRVLRPGGIAIITVPFLSPVRKIRRLSKPVAEKIRNVNLIRKLLGRGLVDSSSLGEIARARMQGYAVDLTIENGRWEFYQYQFTRKQLRKFLEETGFIIKEEFIEHGDEGILHNFGRLAGKYDFQNSCVQLSLFGKAMRKAIPIARMGHMLCYIVCSSK